MGGPAQSLPDTSSTPPRKSRDFAELIQSLSSMNTLNMSDPTGAMHVPQQEAQACASLFRFLQQKREEAVDYYLLQCSFFLAPATAENASARTARQQRIQLKPPETPNTPVYYFQASAATYPSSLARSRPAELQYSLFSRSRYHRQTCPLFSVWPSSCDRSLVRLCQLNHR